MGDEQPDAGRGQTRVEPVQLRPAEGDAHQVRRDGLAGDDVHPPQRRRLPPEAHRRVTGERTSVGGRAVSRGRGGPSGSGSGSTPAPATRPASRASVVTDRSRASSSSRPHGAAASSSVRRSTAACSCAAGLGGDAVAVDEAPCREAGGGGAQSSSLHPRAGCVTSRGAPPTAAASTWAAQPSMPCGEQRGVVAVAAVLAQQGEAVPQREERLVGPREGDVGREQRPARRPARRRPRRSTLGGRREVGVRRRPSAEHVAQGGVGAGQPGRQRLRGRRHRPHLGDGPGDHGRVEVVEGRRHRAQRPPRRAAPPGWRSSPARTRGCRPPPMPPPRPGGSRRWRARARPPARAAGPGMPPSPQPARAAPAWYKGDDAARGDHRHRRPRRHGCGRSCPTSSAGPVDGIDDVGRARRPAGRRCEGEDPPAEAARPTTWTVTEVVPGRSFTWQRDGARAATPPAGTRSRPPATARCEVRLALEQAGPLGSLVGLLYRGLTKRYVQMEADGLTAPPPPPPPRLTRQLGCECPRSCPLFAPELRSGFELGCERPRSCRSSTQCHLWE